MRQRQRWGCNRCGHTFTNLVTKHSPYPVRFIMEAICRYNLGYSARETIRYLTRRFHITVPEKTFRRWHDSPQAYLHLPHYPDGDRAPLRARGAFLRSITCSIARCTSIPCTTVSSIISSRSRTTAPMRRSEIISRRTSLAYISPTSSSPEPTASVHPSIRSSSKLRSPARITTRPNWPALPCRLRLPTSSDMRRSSDSCCSTTRPPLPSRSPST